MRFGIDLFGNYPESIMRQPVCNRICMWLAYGEQGISSRTIFDVLSGMEKPDEFPYELLHNIPLDPSDFRRCYLLLRLIPEWRERLGEVAEAHPTWKPFVENWDKLTQLYEEERSNASVNAPKLYKFMQELRGI